MKAFKEFSEVILAIFLFGVAIGTFFAAVVLPFKLLNWAFG